MEIEQTPAEPEPPPHAIRLLWPEAAPESPDKVDNESAILNERRVKAFRLYTKGRTMRQIAEEIKCSLGTVSNYVNHILASYRLMGLQDAKFHLDREVAKLATVEAELWEAWEKSKGMVIEETTGRRGTSGGDFAQASIKRRQRDGDPRWMKLIQDNVRQRCRLLGIEPDEAKIRDGLPPVKLVAGIDPLEVV
jgi:hypothetical protein